MQQLWTKLQAEHGCCMGKRQPLLQLLQQLDRVGLLGVTPCVTCFARDGIAGLTERLLAGVSDSLGDDFGVLLETSRAFWGDKVMLHAAGALRCQHNSVRVQVFGRLRALPARACVCMCVAWTRSNGHSACGHFASPVNTAVTDGLTLLQPLSVTLWVVPFRLSMLKQGCS
jgi:hypothetical protein